MAFEVNYNVGGVIDLIKKVRLPGFPTLPNPFTKGLKLSIPALVDIYTISYTPDVDMELAGVMLACSGYSDEDYWELEIDGVKYYETIYTKELPEMSVMQGIISVTAGTPITLSFYNDSGTGKIVWFNLKFFK